MFCISIVPVCCIIYNLLHLIIIIIIIIMHLSRNLWYVSLKMTDKKHVASFLFHCLVVEYSPMGLETGVQSQIKSYQRLKKYYLIPSCLTLSIIRYRSRKWSNPGKGVVPSSTRWCSSYWKGNFRVALNYGRPVYYLLTTDVYWCDWLLTYTNIDVSEVCFHYHTYIYILVYIPNSLKVLVV